MLKKIAISAIKSLIVLILGILVLSSNTFDLTELVDGAFEDIYKYASSDIQKQVINKLEDSCSILEQGGIIIEDNKISVNVDKIKALCQQYKSGNINDEMFFSSYAGNSMQNQQIEIQKVKVLDNYNSLITYLQKNWIALLVLLSLLILILYFLIKDTKLFLIVLSGAFFSVGAFILLPYLAILAFHKFIGIDTSIILGNLINPTVMQPTPRAIADIAMLMILRTYDNTILAIGTTFLSLGVVGKIGWFYNNNRKKAIKQKNRERL